MIIDFHTHIFLPQMKNNREQYIDRDPLFKLLYSNPKARIATADDLITDMDKQGVDISIVLNIAWNSPELCRETNDYILESVSRFSKRLVGFGMITLDSPENALKELELCIQGGIKGIGEIRPSQKILQNVSIIKLVIQKISDNKLILLTHSSEPVGHIYPGKGYITPEVLYPLITGFPELKLVCAHWGGGLPFYNLMPEVKKALDNVYFDSAASPFLYNSRIYNQVIQLLGPEKILFGSDYPLLQPQRLLNEIKALNLEGPLFSQITAENAQKILGIRDKG